MNSEVIVTCAVTGAGDAAGKHPGLPITPRQIADAAIEAARAGAAVAHIHVRDPKTGKAARDTALYRQVVEHIRQSDVDVVINLTAGMGGDFVPSAEDPARGGPGTDMASAAERVAHVEELRPEICTLDCGSVNYAETAYIATPAQLREMARRIKACGVKPEIEAFELGHIWMAKQLMAEGLIDAPALFQLCLGIPFAAEANTETLLTMRNMLPPGAHWASFAISRMQMPMVAQSVLLGGHVRVGLEDNLYLEKGVLASNGQLVEKAIRILRELGARPLSPAEARTKLGLRQRN